MQLCEAFEPPQPLLEYQQAPLPYPVGGYLLTMAYSGDRKGAVDHLALKAARDWEQQ